MPTREQVILEVWERTGKDVLGASELDLVQRALSKRFGNTNLTSPASIARVLADHGVRLGHPEILQADTRWREQQSLFTADDLGFGTLDAANALIEKVEHLRRQYQTDNAQLERVRQSVRQLKADIDSLAAGARTDQMRRELAQEVAQWLTVWLQNPQIFADWLALRRSTAEFQELFGTFQRSQANTNDQRAQLAHEPEKRTQR